MTPPRTRNGWWLLLAGLCACTGPGPSHSGATDRTDASDHTDEPDPYVNPAWNPDECDFVGFEWAVELGSYNPYRDGFDRMKWIGAEEDGFDVDLMSATWYEERGAIAGPSVYDYRDESFHTAAAYAMILIQCDGACEERYLATSGRVTVTSAGYNEPRFEGVLEQVVLQEGSFDRETQVSEVFPDGRTWCFERAVMSTELTTYPPSDW